MDQAIQGSDADSKRPRRSGAFARDGAGKRNRTPDLLITNELLYRLSYTGEWGCTLSAS